MEDNRPDISAVMKTIEHCLANGEYRQVVDLCEAIQLADDLPRKFWFCKARALENLGDKRGAVEAIRSEIALLKRVPPELLGQIGVLLGELGKYVESAVCLNESCVLSPSADGLILLASALANLGRLEQARDTIQRALEMEPDNDEAWHNLGAYTLDENPLEAERAFRRALELNPTRSDSYGGIGRACLAQGKISDAIDAAQEGLERNPLDGICHLVVGAGLERLMDLDGAEATYSKAYRCDFDKVTALLGVARVCERRGQINETEQWYRRGLHGWPDHVVIRTAYLAFAERHRAATRSSWGLLHATGKINGGEYMVSVCAVMRFSDFQG